MTSVGGRRIKGESKKQIFGTDRVMDINMIDELRNRHVKKLLNHLGGTSVPPYLQKAIKRSYSEFVEDINKQNKDKKHGQKTQEDPEMPIRNY